MARDGVAPHIKAEAIAMLLSGSSDKDIAKKLSVDPVTVYRWRKKLPANQLQAIANEKQNDLDSKIAMFMHRAVDGMINVAGMLADKEYCFGQKASDLGILTGVITDKLILFLEAAQLHEENSAGTVTPEDVRNMSDDELHKLIAEGINRSAKEGHDPTRAKTLDYEEFSRQFSEFIQGERERRSHPTLDHEPVPRGLGPIPVG